MLDELRIDAFIAGAEKAGTTSLAHYLSLHPSVLCHVNSQNNNSGSIIEFSSFVDGRCLDERSFLDDYFDAFGRLPAAHELVLAKNVSIMDSLEGARRLRQHSPMCRIILSLRHPVERAYSSFWYQRYRGEETFDTFEDAVRFELENEGSDRLSFHRRYLARGVYYDSVKRMIELFGRERVHIVVFERLKNSPIDVVEEAFRFLHLVPVRVDVRGVYNSARLVLFPSIARLINKESLIKSAARRLLGRNRRRKIIQWVRQVNSRPGRPDRMNENTRKMLLEYFRPHNEELEKLIGMDLGHWNR